MTHKASRLPRAVALLSLVFTALLWFLIKEPYQWLCLFLGLTVFFMACAAAAGHKALQNAALVMGILFLGFFGMEFYYAPKSLESAPARYAVDIPIELMRLIRNDATLEHIQSSTNNLRGTGAAPPRKEGSYLYGRMEEGSHQPIFLAKYSFLPSGWRLTPQHAGAEKAVVFLGCSYAFGWGLDDEDSIPYKVSALLGPDYQVFNFAVNGHGAHQIVSQIESGLLDDILAAYKEVTVFFLTFASHPERSYPRMLWPASGPWYELENGQVTRKGMMPEDHFSTQDWYVFFNKSYIFQKFMRMYEKTGKKRAMDLYLALIERASRLATDAGARFGVIAWPGLRVVDRIQQQGVAVLDLAPFFPDYKNRQKYLIHELDFHPNALAAEIAARAIAEDIANGRDKPAPYAAP